MATPNPITAKWICDNLFHKVSLIKITPPTEKTIPISKESSLITPPSQIMTCKRKQSPLSPVAQKILDAVSTSEKKYLLKELELDDTVIAALEDDEFMKDPEYIAKMDYGGLGFYMESYVCAYGKCPVCGQQTLHKYSKPNLPVVDLMCINYEKPPHSGSRYLFQLKMSVTRDYFDKNDKYIITGSPRFGDPIFTIPEGNSMASIVPGFICLRLRQQNDKYVFVPGSFSVVPKKMDTNMPYYKLVTVHTAYGDKPGISWDDKVSIISGVEKLIMSPSPIISPFQDDFNISGIPNPFLPSRRKLFGGSIHSPLYAKYLQQYKKLKSQVQNE